MTNTFQERTVEEIVYPILPQYFEKVHCLLECNVDFSAILRNGGYRKPTVHAHVMMFDPLAVSLTTYQSVRPSMGESKPVGELEAAISNL